jgi:hypothetical protein
MSGLDPKDLVPDEPRQHPTVDAIMLALGEREHWHPGEREEVAITAFTAMRPSAVPDEVREVAGWLRTIAIHQGGWGHFARAADLLEQMARGAK